MIVEMLITIAYYLIIAVWVSGFGSDALVAVGFTMTIYMVTFGLNNGLAAGVAFSIPYRIGARDKLGASNTAEHVVLLI